MNIPAHDMNGTNYQKLKDVHIPLIQSRIRLRKSQAALEIALSEADSAKYNAVSLDNLFAAANEHRTQLSNQNIVVCKVKQLVWHHSRQDPENPDNYERLTQAKEKRFNKKRLQNPFIFNQKAKLPMSLYRCLMDNGHNYRLSRHKKGQNFSGVSR